MNNKNKLPIGVSETELEHAQKREESDRVGGREIKGLESKPERFSRLEEGRDYEIVKQNPEIESERPMSDFFVFLNPTGGDVTLTVVPPHWRTISTPDVKSVVLISDPEGKPKSKNYYYEVNTKGVGYLKPSVRGDSFDEYDTWEHDDRLGLTYSGTKNLGLSSEDIAVFDTSNFLMINGLRCELHWAIAKLKRAYFKGKPRTLSTLAKNGVTTDESFYEEIRLLKTNDRIEEAFEADDRRGSIFKKAFEIFNLEGKDSDPNFEVIEYDNPEHQRLFFKQFANRMGSNIAILLNLGWRHGHLHSANITMAAEIVDVDTARHFSKLENKEYKKVYNGVRQAHLKDMRDAIYSIRKLLLAAKTQGLHTGTREDLAEAFLQGFDKSFDFEAVGSQKTDPVKAREWMSKIVDTVIVQRQNLPPLLHNKVEDWPIKI